MIGEFEQQVAALEQFESLKKEKDAVLMERTKNLPSDIVKTRKAIGKSQLKSDLKKSTAFVKKLRAINSEGLQQCIRDTETLNLNLYLTEVVTAIVEINFKAADVPGIVKLSVSLHQRYGDFAEPLIVGLREAVFDAQSTTYDGKQKRILVRMIIELFNVGLCSDDELLCQLLRFLIGKGKVKKPMDLAGLTTYIKYGSEILFGKVPSKVQQLVRTAGKKDSETPVNVWVTASALADLNLQISEAYQQLSNDLVKSHKTLRALEKRLDKDRLVHGSLSDNKQEELDLATRIFERLLSTVTALADGLIVVVPTLEEERDDTDASGGISVWDNTGATTAAVDVGPYGDSESRMFYEDLPDLLTIVPLTALGLNVEQVTALREAWKVDKEKQYGTCATGDEVVGEEVVVEVNDSEEVVPVEEDDEDGSRLDVSSAAKPGDESMQSKIAVLLQEKLVDSVNKVKADEFSVQFCYHNTKNARKKLIQALIKVPRTRYELIPNYARVVASLNRVFPEVGPAVVEGLFNEFYGIQKAKTQMYLDNKIKNVRYLGELVKFGIAAPIIAFKMCKIILADFSHHNIDLFAVLLETCGRYLFVLPFTHERMNEFLDTMLRFRRAKNLDLRQQTLLEAAYFAVKPPERTLRVKKEKTKFCKFVHYLLFQKLGKSGGGDVEAVIRLLRKLPWEEEEENISMIVVKAMLKVCRTKYIHIPLIADCIAGLSRFRSKAFVCLMDRAFEEVLRALEMPHKREPQRILGMIRLIGELYNYTAISSSIIFDVLYLIIHFGHEIPSQGGSAAADVTPTYKHFTTLPLSAFDPRVPSQFDPILDHFRTQMVCELLKTCGHYFAVSAILKGKLSTFLTYFQRYLICKPAGLPFHVEFAVLDVFDSLEETVNEAIAKKERAKEDHRKPNSKRQKQQRLLEAQAAAAAVAARGNNFTRYGNFEQVQLAIDVVELNVLEKLKASEASAVGEVVEEDDEEDRDAVEEGEEDGNEESSEDDQSDEEDEDSGSEEEDSEEEEEEEKEDEEVVLAREAKRMEERQRIAEEDDDFEKAFRSVMQESVETAQSQMGASATGIPAPSQSSGPRVVTDVDRMALPGVLPKPKNMGLWQQQVRSNQDDSSEDDDCSDDDHVEDKYKKKHHVVAFKLLSRDNKGRVETRQLMVSEENPMAVKLAQSEAIFKEERQRHKEKLLQLHSMAQESESMESQYGVLGSSHRHSNNTLLAPQAAGTSSTSAPVAGEKAGGAPVVTAVASRSGASVSGFAYSAQPARVSSQAHHHSGGGGGGARRQPQQPQAIRAVEHHRSVDTLNLDEFLAETSAADNRRPVVRQLNPSPQVNTSGGRGGKGGRGGRGSKH